MTWFLILSICFPLQMFVSTYDETRKRAGIQQDEDSDTAAATPTDSTPSDLFSPPTPTGPVVAPNELGFTDRPPITEITGAWSALADEHMLGTAMALEELKLHAKSLPNSFKGFATPELNPMVGPFIRLSFVFCLSQGACHDLLGDCSKSRKDCCRMHGRHHLVSPHPGFGFRSLY